MWIKVNKKVECVTTNQAIELQADSQSGHGTSIFPEGPVNSKPTTLLKRFWTFHSQSSLFFFPWLDFFIFFSYLGHLEVAFCLMPKKCFLSPSAWLLFLTVFLPLCRTPGPVPHFGDGKALQQEFLSESAVWLDRSYNTSVVGSHAPDCSDSNSYLHEIA